MGNANTSSFPYTLGAEIKQPPDSAHTNIWKLYEATKTSEKSQLYTAFVLEKQNVSQPRINAALNCLNKLKIIRHPHILQYENSIVMDDKIYMITEHVTPLLTSFDANDQNCESFICLGIHQLSSAIAFVHSSLKSVHACINPTAIFVSQSGDWKLGSFELAHNYKQIPHHLSNNLDLLPSKYQPQEMKHKSFIHNLKNNNIHSLDSWCEGCLIFDCFSRISSLSSNVNVFHTPQQLKSQIECIPNGLQSCYRKLLAGNPNSRISAQQLMDNCTYLSSNSLVHTSHFLSEIAIKSDSEKAQFLKHLDMSIDQYPVNQCKYKILPALTHLLEHGSGSNPIMLSIVLKISKLFVDEIKELQLFICPPIINLFGSNERGTRVNLLKNLHTFIDYLTEKMICKEIWPHLMNGFTDASPVLRESTVRSMIFFAPKMSQKLLSSELLPILEKVQSTDMEPAIRTNTIIVLGKIAKFLHTQHSQSNGAKNELALVKCFARSLQDPFMHCRNASLTSITATIGLFSSEMLASKMLPLCIVCTIDPYEEVRNNAFKCIEIGIQQLQQKAMTMPKTPVVDDDGKDGKSSTFYGSSRAKMSESSHYSKTEEKSVSGSMISSLTSNLSAKVTAMAAAQVVGNTIGSIGSWTANTIGSITSSANKSDNNKSSSNSHSFSSKKYSENVHGLSVESKSKTLRTSHRSSSSMYDGDGGSMKVKSNHSVDDYNLDDFFGSKNISMKSKTKNVMNGNSSKKVSDMDNIFASFENSSKKKNNNRRHNIPKKRKNNEKKNSSKSEQLQRKKSKTSKHAKEKSMDDFFADWNV